MKIHFFIWLSLLIASPGILAADGPSPVPENGILDLRQIILSSDALFSLNGEWEFYWQKLLTPENYPAEKHQKTGNLVYVPSYFSNYQVDGKLLPGMGYGTYCLTILLPENNQSSICFDIPVFDVAYNLYVNDRLMEANGKVGTSREEEQPWYEPSSFCFIPQTDTIRVIIQVSNFHHRRGGFWRSMFVGGSKKVLDRIERRRMYNYSTIGVLFFFTLFFFIFWMYSKKQILLLLFAVTALGMLMRSVNTGLYFSNLFVHTPWSWQIRMEYFGSYLAYIFGMMFLHQMFPMRHMKYVIRANTLLFSLASISLFILPVHLFAYEMLLYQPLTVLLLLQYLVKSFTGIFKRKTMDTIFFVALAFFIFTLVNDILLANSGGAGYSNYFSQISFQLFIFAMAVLIIMEWVGNYNEKLHLQTALVFKNKVLAVIAHDLKNPVASVAQFSDLLVKKPELIKEKNILESLQESSQAAVTLLDNLLYWSRSQADELKVTPEVFDVEKLINEVKSLYSHMAIQKDLHFKTEVTPGIAAYADRALVNIVVRNLVSNAIKFTRRDGSVQLRAFQEEDLVRITIIDTGVGIKPEILWQFQNQGTMGSSSGTESEIGTGLGLQLVQDLVERNQGTLHIESLPGKGSTFTFTIPISIPST